MPGRMIAKQFRIGPQLDVRDTAGVGISHRAKRGKACADMLGSDETQFDDVSINSHGHRRRSSTRRFVLTVNIVFAGMRR